MSHFVIQITVFLVLLIKLLLELEKLLQMEVKSTFELPSAEDKIVGEIKEGPIFMSFAANILVHRQIFLLPINRRCRHSANRRPEAVFEPNWIEMQSVVIFLPDLSS